MANAEKITKSLIFNEKKLMAFVRKAKMQKAKTDDFISHNSKQTKSLSLSGISAFILL